MENYFEDLKKFKNSLVKVELPSEVEIEVLKAYAVEAIKKYLNKEEKDETMLKLKELAEVFK